MPLSSHERLMRVLEPVLDDERVERAIRETPRERFIPDEVRPYAHENHALPIGHGQTISQPTMVAIMTAALGLRGHERVLEIGTGSGYQAAILARLAREVITVEIVDELRERAAEILADLELDNVHVVDPGDDLGAPSLAPFDAIIVTAAAPAIPPPLVDQLSDGGRLVIPVGSRWEQVLLTVTRTGDDTQIARGVRCAFVPLIGQWGFADETQA